MLDLGEALEICRKHFPKGPEHLAQEMGIEVVRQPLDGCEGWCVNGPSHTIVRINSGSPLNRQRFTLAHELAHLLLGTAPDLTLLHEFGCSPEDNEESQVDHVASEMLLPKQEIMVRIGDVRPIRAEKILGIAKDANTSEMMVARRIVTLANHLGLHAAFISAFFEGRWKWAFPREVCPRERTLLLFNEARKHSNEYFYERQGRDNSAILLDSPSHWSTLLVQSVGRSPSPLRLPAQTQA